MKERITLGDRVADWSLAAIAVANLVFLAAFLAALVLAAGKVHAEETVACTGENLLLELKRDAPEKLAEIRAGAARIENGDGLLWKIETDGAGPSWLFGTMHMSDPRVLKLPETAQRAFDASSTVVIETTDVLDQKNMMAAMLATPELMMFVDDTTLTSLLSPRERETLEAGLAERGIPLASVQKMKPWVIASMVALPACELARKAAGAPVLDLMLAAEAESAGKALGGLETVADQLGAMASLPMEFHIDGLIGTLSLGERVDDVMETMLVLYLEGETGMFWPFMSAALPEAGMASDYARFEETMITARNRNMAERAAPFIHDGGAFIAVGALHLPGEEGLVSLLRDAGYAVSVVH